MGYLRAREHWQLHRLMMQAFTDPIDHRGANNDCMHTVRPRSENCVINRCATPLL
jgi:hypothetical protein